MAPSAEHCSWLIHPLGKALSDWLLQPGVNDERHKVRLSRPLQGFPFFSAFFLPSSADQALGIFTETKHHGSFRACSIPGCRFSNMVMKQDLVSGVLALVVQKTGLRILSSHRINLSVLYVLE